MRLIRLAFALMALSCLLFIVTCDDGRLHNAAQENSAASPASASLALAAKGQHDPYQIMADGDEFRAVNPAQGFDVRFSAAGLAVSDRGGQWSWTWATVGVGREDAIVTPEAVAPSLDGRDRQTTGVEARGERQPLLVYQRGSFIEWYANRTENLEQGFDLPTRPAGEGMLVIEGAIGGDLTASLRGLNDRVTLSLNGQAVLEYAGLTVTDANGKQLPSWMELASGAVRLLVDDASAVYPVTVDPGLSRAPGWIAELSGRSLATGDFNGDGHDDLLILTYTVVDLFYGSVYGPAAFPNWSVSVGSSNAVASAGDVNGDGYDDVIVGDQMAGNGAAYVYFGSAAGPSATADWTVQSDDAGSRFGAAIASAGDVNGDGYDDIVVGAPAHNGSWSGYTIPEVGAVYLFYGAASGPESSASWVKTMSHGDYIRFGNRVASAGDVNGDGYDDVIVAYSYIRTDNPVVSVFCGAAAGLSTTECWNLTSDLSDPTVASAGDVNNDGYDDIIVGAPLYNSGESREGAAFVYYGAAAGLSGSANWSTESNVAGSRFGYSVASAGDVNGDGYSDIVIGAMYYPSGANQVGAAFVYYGAAAGLPGAADWTAMGVNHYDFFGYRVSSAGDINADGYDDVAISAMGYDNPGGSQGSVFVYYGGCRTGCLYEGTCYTTGDKLPGNECLVCQTAGWSPDDGAACDDGAFCNGADACLYGSCSVHTGAPCADNGAFCDGVESCNEETDACVSSGDPCPDNAVFCDGVESCDEAADACVTTGDPCADDGLFCNGTETCLEADQACGHVGAPNCADGVECNGVETCDEAAQACTPGESICGPYEVCDPTIDQCVLTCTGCVIGNVCYGDGQTNPLNDCQVCDADVSTRKWTDNDGAACNDGVFCNGADTCSAGACVGHVGNPCPDDGYFCNGAESCAETLRVCVHSGEPCDTDQLCVETNDTCTDAGNGCGATASDRLVPTGVIGRSPVDDDPTAMEEGPLAVDAMVDDNDEVFVTIK